MDNNQLGRRNLTSSQFNLLIGRKYNRTKIQHGKNSGGNQYTSHKVEKPQNEVSAKKEEVQNRKNCESPKKQKASSVIAKEHGVSPRTVEYAAKAAEKIDTHATDSIVETVNKGAISLNNAAKVAEMPTDTQEAIAEDIEQGTKQKEAINKHVHVTIDSQILRFAKNR